MAALDTIGLVNIIDECFDKYKGRYTPYDVEDNAHVLSFLLNVNSLIKSNEIFKDVELLNVYKECAEKIIKKLNQIENRKVYEYNFRLGTSQAIEYLEEIFRNLWKYVDRNFPENLTENERKIGYYENINGREIYNGYKENIVIGGSLKPSYNNDIVEYTLEDNPTCIRMNGITEEKPNIELYIDGKRVSNKFYSIDNFINTFKNLNTENLAKFYSFNNPNVLRIYFAFTNGFVVNDMNEYESPNGIIYELFESLYKTLNDKKTNYFREYLKKYFYSGIVSRYREKKIDDKETNLVSTDLNFGKFDNVAPGVYETLSGKGGNIGGIQTIDFDRKEAFDLGEYIRLLFDASYYIPEDNILEIYINKKYLSGGLEKLSKYSSITGDGGYLNYLKNKYSILKYYTGFNTDNLIYLNEADEIENEFLKENLFAVEPYFLPDNTDNSYWNKDFFINNSRNLQKVYFYSNDSYLKEDNILKELSYLEKDGKPYVKSQRKRNISIKSNNDYLIICIKIEDKINTENINGKKKLYLGNGYINLKKVPQKFKDNRTSKLIDNNDTNKTSYFESEEFSSILDDREITVIHTSQDVYFTRTERGETNAFTGEYLDATYDKDGKVKFEKKSIGYYKENQFPKFKYGILRDKNEYFELECTDFAKHIDIGSVKQIRLMIGNNNSSRYLFNVRSATKKPKKIEASYFELNDIEDLNEYGLSYVINNDIFMSDSAYEYNIKEKTVSIKNSKFEDIKVRGNELNITWKKDVSDKNYIFDLDNDGDLVNNTHLIINDGYTITRSSENKNDYILNISENPKEDERYDYSYYLILEKGAYTGSKEISIPSVGNVEILDYIQSTGRPERKEFLYSIYDEQGKIKIENYIPEHEPKILHCRGAYKDLKLNFSIEDLIFDKINNLTFVGSKKRFNIKFKRSYELRKNLLLERLTKKFNIKFKKTYVLNKHKYAFVIKKILLLEKYISNDYNLQKRDAIKLDLEKTNLLLNNVIFSKENIKLSNFNSLRLIKKNGIMLESILDSQNDKRINDIELNLDKNNINYYFYNKLYKEDVNKDLEFKKGSFKLEQS